MATQNLAARIAGSGGIKRATVTSPVYLMASIDGAARLGALLGHSPLPGAQMSGSATLTASLALGAVLASYGQLTLGGEMTIGAAVELELSGGVTFGGAGGATLTGPDLTAAGGVTIDGALLISAGAAFVGLAA